ncbi:unnamed protein product [Ilex paraguariensis]|uniref:Reticulon-like protein n=1 Tax=Ilex paraguariensis TaxID=185542 RepID=A0ABC8RHE0_9AQUA
MKKSNFNLWFSGERTRVGDLLISVIGSLVKMACQAMHYWTFSGLVGAFVDLAIAYLLLCASTITFFASKFLGIFGLCLPCPCNGLFGTPNRNYCLHRMLLDLPAENVSNVQFSIKTKFPFDSIWVKEQNCHLNMMLVKERDGNVDGFVEVEGEASCSFISDAKKSQIVAKRDLVPRTEIGVESGMIESPGVKEERFDLKGKGVENQMPKGGIRRRRKVGAACGILSSVSSYDPSSEDKQDIPLNPSINNEGNEIIEGSSMPATAGIDANHQCKLCFLLLFQCILFVSLKCYTFINEKFYSLSLFRCIFLVD